MESNGRRTQQERRDSTRQALLDATVASLTELGYAGASTTEVQRRAGVSRGALLHHFPSKASLLVAAVQHLAELRGRELHQRAQALPEDERAAQAFSLLWESFSGPLFLVSLELRYAARHDAELRHALIEAEQRLHGNILKSFRLLFRPSIAQDPAFEEAIALSVQFMSGVAMTDMLHKDPAIVEALLGKWRSLFGALFSAHSHNETSPPRRAPAGRTVPALSPSATSASRAEAGAKKSRSLGRSPTAAKREE